MQKNILSLFDGMSCCQLALNRAGIPYDTYYASEIDKYAIQVTQHNFPNTIQIGDVRNVKGADYSDILLIAGGSPCQSFSFAGKRKGMSTTCEQEILTLDRYLELKEEKFEFEGQSYLFWEYMRLLKEVKPKYFLLENVMMGEKWQGILTRAIGINPIKINSSLLSAQNRERLYWTNIGAKPNGLFDELYCMIPQPKDRGILLKDILEKDVPEKYFLSDKIIAGFEKHKQRHDEKGTGFGFKPKTEEDEKGNSLRANGALAPTDNMIYTDRLKEISPYQGDVLHYEDEKMQCLSAQGGNKLRGIGVVVKTETGQVGYEKPFEESDKAQALLQRDYKGMSNYGINVVVETTSNEPEPTKPTEPTIEETKNYLQWDTTGKGHNSQGQRAYFEDGKSGTLGRGSENSGQVQPKVVVTDEIKNPLKGATEFGWHFEQNVYDADGKTRALKSSEGSGNKLKVILPEEEKRDTPDKPKYIGNIYHKEGEDNSNKMAGRVYTTDGKGVTLCAMGGGGGAKTGLYAVNAVGDVVDGLANDDDIECTGGLQENATTYINKSTPMTAAMGMGGGHTPIIKSNYSHSRIRRLTPVECERLQTAPDFYTCPVSDSQRYKMLGNGWTVEVIAYIMSFLNEQAK